MKVKDKPIAKECPFCGYTDKDKRIYMDHYLCVKSKTGRREK